MSNRERNKHHKELIESLINPACLKAKQRLLKKSITDLLTNNRRVYTKQNIINLIKPSSLSRNGNIKLS